MDRGWSRYSGYHIRIFCEKIHSLANDESEFCKKKNFFFLFCSPSFSCLNFHKSCSWSLQHFYHTVHFVRIVGTHTSDCASHEANDLIVRKGQAGGTRSTVGYLRFYCTRIYMHTMINGIDFNEVIQLKIFRKDWGIVFSSFVYVWLYSSLFYCNHYVYS